MRCSVPLLLLVGCLVLEVSATLRVYRQTVETPYNGFNFELSGTRQLIQDRVANLNLVPVLLLVCERRVCPNLDCPRNYYDFLNTRQCTIMQRQFTTRTERQEGALEDHESSLTRAAQVEEQSGVVTDDDEVYIEYYLEAGPTANIQPLADRRDAADTSLLADGAFVDQNSTLPQHLAITSVVVGTDPLTPWFSFTPPASTPTPIPQVSTPTPTPQVDDNDDSADSASAFYGMFIWFWLWMVFLILCCLCCLALLFLWCKKKDKKERPRDGQYIFFGSPYKETYKESQAEREARERAEERERAKRTAVFKPGDKVEGFFDGGWHPATVQGGNNVQGYEIHWDDGSRSEGYLARDIRPYRVRTSEWKDARFAVGEPVVALSGGHYHSGWVYDMHDEDATITVEKPDGTFRRVPETNVDYDPQGA